MTSSIDETHDPNLRSWVESSRSADTDFPIQNLPFGVFCLPGERRRRLGVAIGDEIVDLPACLEAGCLDGLAPSLQQACLAPSLNDLMELGRDQWHELRQRLSQLLRVGASEAASVVLARMDQVEFGLPATIGDYTDFYASLYHATNVGRMFRPDNPLLPNYKYIPIGYHGRASSVVVSGAPIRRPHGQLKAADASEPTFASTRLLDYEMEVGFFVGTKTELGDRVALTEAESHIFGLCLLNDWSARDVQAWEYQPLGPFLAKSFATTISPWVVTLEALAPFRCPVFQRPEGDPPALPYLADGLDEAQAGLELKVEVWLASERMREMGLEPIRLSQGSFRDMYWTLSQMLTHHASNGCPLRAGDLMGSGTVSGKEPGSEGSLLELTKRGAQPLELPSGESRSFLEDGDEVLMQGYCERPGRVRIGFGECRGVVLPASDRAEAAVSPSAVRA